MFLNFIFSILLFFGAKHDVPITTYNLHFSDFEINVEIEFHTEDLVSFYESKNQKLTKKKLENYIKQYSIWKINNEKVEIEFCEMQVDKFHQTLSANIFTSKKITSVEILNNTFIEDIEGFSNVYYFFQENEKVRGFRSHLGRRVIKVEL